MGNTPTTAGVMLRDAVSVQNATMGQGPSVCLMHGHGQVWVPELPMSPRVCSGFGAKMSVFTPFRFLGLLVWTCKI